MHTGSKDARSTDVVIVGSSYVGLTLALALVHELGSEITVAVVDREPARKCDAIESGRDPRASAISAASRNLFETLSLWSRLEDVAVPIAAIELTDTPLNAGVRRSILTYDNTIEGADDAASYIIPNDRIAVSLERAAAACPSIKRFHGETLAGFTADGSCAKLTMRSGIVMAASLAIAADGRKSGLREAADIRTVSWGHGQSGIVTAIRHEFDHGNRAIQHFLPSGPFAMLPLAGGRRSCVTWSENAAEARRILDLGDGAFLDEVDMRVAGRLGAVTLDGPRKSWPLSTHLARRFVAPRLALAGDAAHGVHPIAGQGLNLGLRDVAALVECVSDAARVGLDLADPDALARYEQWRRFDTTVSTATYGGLNRLFSNDVPLARSMREVGLGVLDRMPMIKRAFVNEAAGLSGVLPRLLRAPHASLQ